MVEFSRFSRMHRGVTWRETNENIAELQREKEKLTSRLSGRPGLRSSPPLHSRTQALGELVMDNFICEVEIEASPEDEDGERAEKRARKSEDRGVTSCPICLEDLGKGEAVSLLECGHSFHRDCVAQVKRKCCPMCRAPFEDEMANFLELIMSAGGDLSLKDGEGRMAIHLAARRGNLKLIQQLTGLGVDVHACDGNNKSALFHACRTERIDVARYLLDQGLDPDKCDDKGQSSLHWAASENNVELVTLLLERGASVSLQDSDGWNALHFAAREGSLEVAKYLLEHAAGLDIHTRDAEDKSALYHAVRMGREDVTALLLEKGLDPNLPDSRKVHPIHWAVRERNFAIAKLLVDNGCDVNRTDNDGWSAIHFLAARKD